VAKSRVPVDAMDLIVKQGLDLPVLHGFGNGGYVMYRLSDSKGNLQHKVVIDGRTNVVPPELWKKFMAAYLGQENWREYFEYFAEKPQTVLWKSESPLLAILLASKEWCLVNRSGSEKEGFVVFVSREQFERRKEELKAENCT
jgi:hypothetical protein